MKNRFMTMITVTLTALMALSFSGVAAQGTATPMATPIMPGPGLQAAVDNLIANQAEDGSFVGFSGDPDAGTTVDAVVALVAASNASIETGTSIDMAISWLTDSGAGADYANLGAGQAAKLALAVTAAGGDPTAFGDLDLLTMVQDGLNTDTNIYGSGLYDHAYAILALTANHIAVPEAAITAAVDAQASNGGWAWDGSTAPENADSNTTAMLVQALVASGNADSDAVMQAQAFLESVVTPAGAAYAVGADADGNSTALVLQAMIALKADTAGLASALLMFQNADGSFFYMANDMTPNLFTTVQAVPAAAKQAFPVMPAMPMSTPVSVMPDLAA